MSITLAGQAYRTILQIASTVLLARLLTPADFGLIAMVTAVIGVSELFRDFGLSSAAIQAKHVSKSERDNLFWANTLFGVLSTVVVAAVAPLIGLLYDDDRVPLVVVALAISFTMSGMVTQYRADLTRRLKFTALTVTEVIAPTAGFATAVVLAFAGWGYWALIVQQLLSVFLLLVLSVIVARWIPGLPDRRTSIKRFMRFGVALFGTQLISYVTKNIDNIAIGVVWGPTPLGYYDRAYQLLMTPLNQINAPTTRVALPILARVHDDKPTFERYLLRAQIVGGYVTATLFALAAGLANSLVLVLFGKDWLPVVPIFAILSLGGMLRATAQISYWMFLAGGRTGSQLKMFLVVRPVMIACILAGLPWGAVGVAVGSTLAYSLHWIVSLLWASRATDVSAGPLLRNIVRILLTVSIPCGVIGWGITMLGWSPLVTLGAGIVASIVYLGLAALIFRPVRQDLSLVIGFGVRSLGLRGRA